jgi:hypothetical protein
VVLIDVEIALRRKFEVEGAMLREKLQHVIEEADAGGDLIAAPAFDAQFAADLRFFGIALEFSCSGQLRPPVS